MPTYLSRHWRLFLAAIAVTIAAVSAVSAPSAASAAVPRMYFGAVGNSAPALQKYFGVRVANHAYAQLTDKVPQGRMITMRDNGVKWATVAAAKAGSSIYRNLVRWARTLKARGGLIFFAYHHEPEASGSKTYGTAADYVRAYRHVVSIFRAQGARNVKFVWQMTSWAFAAKASDPRHAARWYPGNAYVDYVGSDAYNWFNWGPGRGQWLQLSTVLQPTLSFARVHHKHVIVAEFGCAISPRRANWMNNAHAYLARNRSIITAAFYFQTNRGHPWTLTTGPEKAAFDAIARDSANFRT